MSTLVGLIAAVAGAVFGSLVGLEVEGSAMGFGAGELVGLVCFHHMRKHRDA
jgi:hypothetical protein